MMGSGVTQNSKHITAKTNPKSNISAGDNSRFRIHPGVGVARVGNSAGDFFIGPEAPGWNPPPEGGAYKDEAGCIKRQAARFRVYEYDEAGKPVREIDNSVGSVTWTVHIANKKGAWYKFVGRDAWHSDSQKMLRNPNIEANLEPNLRKSLIIDPGLRSIAGTNSGPINFDGGEFLGKEVNLGEIRTDTKGRLLVLGGDGSAASALPNNPLTDFANNDGWYDNIADGWVEAKVSLPDGSTYIAEKAWVIIAPPAFAPQMHSLVTLNDLVNEVALEQGWCKPTPNLVYFYRDIFPLLQRTSDLAWISGPAFRGHGSGKYGSFTDDAHIKIYSNASSETQVQRQKLFSILRNPSNLSDKGSSADSRKQMPLLYGTGGTDANDNPRDWFAILPSQYANMKAWADGNFILDKAPASCPLEKYEVQEQPAALDRAALEYCAGGPFYPGIEMTFIAAEAATWRAPYRINAEWEAGDITRWMATPWQSDFYECTLHWWPTQRPDSVLVEADYLAQTLDQRQSWTRGLPDKTLQGNNDMVTYWSDLGVVLPAETDAGSNAYVERERNMVDWPSAV